MLTRRHLALGLTLLLLGLGASVVVSASSTRRAEARCNGSTPVLVSRYSGGVLVGQESVAYPGTTCDGDRYYAGAVLDAYQDNSCVSVYYLEPLAYFATQGTSCTTNAWSVYSYNDTINTNSVLMSVRPSYLADEWITSSGY